MLASHRVRDGLVAALAALAVWAVFSASVVPVDLMVFLRAARAITHGVSPYVDPSLPSLWSGHAFVYPYLTAWWFVPLAVLPPLVAGALFFALSVGALIASARLFGARGLAPILLVTAAEPVVRGLQLGTLNALLLVGVALAWRYRATSWVLVPALAAVIVAKLFLLPMVAWLVLTRRIRPAAAVVTVSATAVVVGCAIAHLSVGTYLQMLSVLSVHEAPQSSSTTALLLASDASHGVATLAAWVCAGAVIAAGCWYARRRADKRWLFVACLIASIVASPIVWSHYYTLLVAVPLVLRWRARAVLAVLLCSWLLLVPAEGGALRVLHPFPGAGLVWTGLVLALMWHFDLVARRVNALVAV